MQTATLTGERYFSTFTDAKSHHVSIYLQKTKDQTLSCFQIYAPRAEIVTGERINLFRSDRGGEYGSEGFKTYLHEKGIQHEKMNTYTPKENGVSERMNQTLVEMAHCLLHDAALPDTFWGYAVQHSAHILNSLPSHALDSSTMPEEIFTGNKPSIANLRIFGCKAYAHIPKEK
jgi:transposase InsO family protein